MKESSVLFEVLNQGSSFWGCEHIKKNQLFPIDPSTRELISLGES